MATKFKFTFEMDPDAIEAGISGIAKRASELREDTHMLACSILRQWASDGNAKAAKERATRLLKAVDEYSGQAVVNWFGVYAKFEYSEKDGFRYTETTVTAEVYQAAKAEPYWKLSPPKPLKPFDLNEGIKSLIQRAKTAQKKADEQAAAGGERVEMTIPAETLAALEALLRG